MRIVLMLMILMAAAVYLTWPQEVPLDPKTPVKAAVLEQLRYPNDAIFGSSGVDRLEDGRYFVRGMVNIKSEKGPRVEATYSAFYNNGAVDRLLIEPIAPVVRKPKRRLPVIEVTPRVSETAAAQPLFSGPPARPAGPRSKLPSQFTSSN